MSSGVLKQVDLTHQVDDLTTVPYLNLGQEIQSRKNLIRYYFVLKSVQGEITTNGFAKACPLGNSSYVNILVDSPDEDYSSPKFLTFHNTQQKLARFGNDIEQECLMIEQDFTRVIKKIRAELGIEGKAAEDALTIKKMGFKMLAGDGNKENIPLDPRHPADFIVAMKGVFVCPLATGTPLSYSIDLPYFRS